tara:strand:- start:389 stop:1069 length:681 start_codon:yes stop_codon:yes gene_type:complete
MDKKIEQIIRESVEKSKNKRKEYIIFDRILVHLLQPTTISFKEVINQIEEKVPRHMFDEIDEIFVGSFDENDSRALEAHYESGAIYITNDMVTVEDYVENIIHETAHSIEQARGFEIYGDQKVQEEFLGKRMTLKRNLDTNGYDIGADFSDIEYSEDFDLYLYKEVGYDKIGNLTSGLFYSPYAATSVNEYFANGLENFFLGDREHLNKISPKLTRKIWEIINDEI